MAEHPDIAVLMTAKSPFDAQVIAGILREAGIPVYIGGRMLNDAFPVAQAMANLLRVDIQVPSDQVEAARSAVAAADEGAKLLEDPAFDPGDPVEPGDPDDAARD